MKHREHSIPRFKLLHTSVPLQVVISVHWSCSMISFWTLHQRTLYCFTWILNHQIFSTVVITVNTAFAPTFHHAAELWSGNRTDWGISDICDTFVSSPALLNWLHSVSWPTRRRSIIRHRYTHTYWGLYCLNSWPNVDSRQWVPSITTT